MPAAVIDTTVSDPNIRELQTLPRGLSHMLPDAGIPLVAVTGVPNDQTENAVRSFQRFKGLLETGNVDLATWTAIVTTYEEQYAPFVPGAPLFPLYNAALAPASDRIPYFTELLQVMLRTISGTSGFFPSPAVTGVWDDATAAAVSVIQMLSGLPATGKPDLPTWNALAGMYNQEMRKVQSVPPIENPY